MFGLKYILQTYHVSFSELAQEMGINRANISMWMRSRRIPEQKLDYLEKKFSGIPREYFSKELAISEKLLVQEMYLSDTDEWYTIEDVYEDDEGKENVYERQVSQHQGVIGHVREDREIQSILERLEVVLKAEGEHDFINRRLVEKFVYLLEEYDEERIEVLKLIFSLFPTKVEADFGGFDPMLQVSKRYSSLHNGIRNLLVKEKMLGK